LPQRCRVNVVTVLAARPDHQGIETSHAEDPMQIDPERLRNLRTERQWSQEQLATLSGLNLRTIQRLESGSRISVESLRALAAVFEVPPDALLVPDPTPGQPGQNAIAAIRDGALRGLDFSGTSSREEFWWFALAVAMVLALADILGQSFGRLPIELGGLVVLLPWLAACTRRLRDAGLNPWWQLISLAPVGGILVLLYLLATPRKEVVAAG